MPLLRFIRWSRQFHRWLAYGLGAVIALWVITGAVMLFPPTPTTRTPAAASIDPTAAVHTPGEAAKSLPLGSTNVRSVTLRDLAGRVVYHFALQDGAHVFVDATTAQRVEFTDSLALALARRVMIDTSVAYTARRITKHDARYRVGVLPALRITLHHAPRTLIHVAGDATVNSTSSRSRLRAAMGALHEFQLPGGRVPNRVRHLLLLFTSALTIILVLTGYVLALPVRRRS